MGRRANGEGSIYRRGDGRWGASAFVDTISGKRKRVHVYGRTRQEVHDQLAEKLTQARAGIRAPDKEWTVGAYLDYWLTTVVAAKNRPRTGELYEGTIRLYLKPALGTIRLTKLSVQDVQAMLNHHLERGKSLRSLHQMRSVLRAALSRAQREELVVRNVAKLVDLRPWERQPIRPWNTEEAARFLQAARSHRLYPAFILLLVYGMRRGEVLGLRWCDIDFEDGLIRVRQQLQRFGSTLQQGPVKTSAGQRDLPVISLLRDELLTRQSQIHEGVAATPTTENVNDLVFLSTAGTPVDPKNFVRTFQDIRAKAGLPRITVHHTRHTAATILKNLGVPARDAQLILGHSHVNTTQQLYQHGNSEGQARALSQVERQLLAAPVAAKTAANDVNNTSDVRKVFETSKNPIGGMGVLPGGSSGARTHDTLLKSLSLLEESLPTTPVSELLKTRVHTQIVGWVAVKKCCKLSTSGPDPDANARASFTILHALPKMATQKLAQRCFPLVLVPRQRRSSNHPNIARKERSDLPR
ncbi:tyrosine-type recombinase/integrase [Nocardiopsis changdeensis]|uniref:tyrosine-type recombinase/integrase n=1 Tax=Nocardiopsis changdeensis TaxID=2831969 RepID=UPI003F45E77B